NWWRPARTRTSWSAAGCTSSCTSCRSGRAAGGCWRRWPPRWPTGGRGRERALAAEGRAAGHDDQDPGGRGGLGHAPVPDRLPPGLKYTTCPPAVVPDLWERPAAGPADTFTTIGNWRQSGQVSYQGEVYTWSKHYEFLKYLDLPRRTGQAFELALSSYEESDKR